MEIPMPAPTCLIENSLAGELRVQQEALQVLAEIPQPVVVVAIAGLYRTGKSYLMNKLAGKRTGFSLGSTVQSHTKGIWMWCMPHPHLANHVLVLLDTEGVGDVKKGDTKNDTWIFALAVLLSSTLVYNSKGTIDQQAMDQLHYMTELTEHVKVKAAGRDGRQEGEDLAKFVRFFPAFVWAVRDFTLQLERDGQEISEDEYLEDALKLQPGSTKEAQLYNLPHECIRQFFPARKCFVFVQPAGRRDLARLEDLEEDELESEFQEQVAGFCRHVWEMSQPKTILGGHVVTGAMLGTLAVTYVDAIRSGAVPCMESAVLALAQIENSAAVGEAVAVYEEWLAQRVTLPTESVREVLELHAQCEQEALRVFMARALKDDDRHFQGELMCRLEEHKQKLCWRNELASSERCTAALKELSDELDNCISQGVYVVPGGYRRFLDDQQQMVERYAQVAGKGIKADAVLQEFLQAKEAVAQSILQTDEALTEKEKETAAQRAQAKVAEWEQQLLRQEAELQRKLEGERQKLLEEQGRMVDQKLKEQAALLEEGFREEARRMEEKIRRLEQQMEEIVKLSWISSALSRLPSAMEIPMPAPICLIENSPAGELRVQQEALRVLAEIPQPMVVVAIAGLYRTGKSYLMNKLAGKRTGFSLGSTVQCHTKGIWMWCVPHPCRASHTLVLLDSEGLGDVEKGDTKNDTWIFALAVLLSSTLVYNSMGTINQQAMDQLHYVTELMERIKVKLAGDGRRQEGEDSAEFVRFFPALVWAVRDFTLELELDGREISKDEYLENALKLKPGSSQRAQPYNLPRECIRQFFPARKCFVFGRPASEKDLARLEELPEHELEPAFREQVSRFCRHVWETSQPKTIPGGHVVTGAMLGNLAVTYVDTIRSGAVPCMETMELALAQIESSAAVREAVAVYEEQLARQVALPTESVQELLELYAQCERAALRVFMARAFKDDDRHFQGELMRRLEEQKQDLCRRNDLISSDRCTAALLELSDDLDNQIDQGVYTVPGGYQRFLDDQRQVVERYRQVPGKGIKADAVLQEFLQAQEAVAQSILQTDEALTETEKEMAAQRAQAEAAEREQQLRRQKEAEQRQMLEDKERSYQENLRQLQEKLEGEKQKLLEEQGRMVDQKLKEQEALLKEGFREEAGRMADEIRRLQQQSEEIQKPTWISLALEALGDVAAIMLPDSHSKAARVILHLLQCHF